MVEKRKAEELLNNMIPDQSAFNQVTKVTDSGPSVEENHRKSKQRKKAFSNNNPESFNIRMLLLKQIFSPKKVYPSQKRLYTIGKKRLRRFPRTPSNSY